MIISEIKNLVFLIINFKELKLLYELMVIIYFQNLIVITKVLEAFHVLVILERENLLEIR